jgi:hypothetical protein
MDPVPRDIFACQVTQHHPWGMAAAHRQHEMAARGDGGPGLCSDNRGTFSGDSFDTRKDVDFHSSLQPAIAGLCHESSLSLR